jgi:hypothetical protein
MLVVGDNVWVGSLRNAESCVWLMRQTTRLHFWGERFPLQTSV